MGITRGFSFMTKSLFFLFVSVVLSLIFSQLFFYQIDGHETATVAVRVVAVNHQLAEFLFAAGLVGFLVSGKAVQCSTISISFTVVFQARFL